MGGGYKQFVTNEVEFVVKVKKFEVKMLFYINFELSGSAFCMIIKYSHESL
jgi:hypothetical protein